jgi:hypothetical protein
MVIDAADSIADCRSLDCQPFPIKNKRARVEIPKFEAPANVTTAAYVSFIHDMEAMEAHWACVYATDLATGSKMNGIKKRKGANTPADISQREIAGVPTGPARDNGPPRVSFGPEPNSVDSYYHNSAMGADESESNEE